MRWRKRREGKGGGKGRVEIWKERRKEREEERMGDPGRCDTEGGVCAKLLARQSGFPERIWIWASSRGWVLCACSLRTYEYMYMCVYVCISQRGGPPPGTRAHAWSECVILKGRKTRRRRCRYSDAGGALIATQYQPERQYSDSQRP